MGEWVGRRSRQGAVMLVVMLLLLTVTAAAGLSIYSTQIEIRAAGHYRKAMQAAATAEGGLVAATTTIEMQGGGRVLEWKLAQAARQPGRVGMRLSLEEPPLREANAAIERMLSSELVPGRAIGVQAAVVDPSMIEGGAFEPHFIVDISDAYETLPTFVGQAHGVRLDGGGVVQMRYLVTTITSRGRIVRRGLLDDYGVYRDEVAMVTAAEAARAERHLRRDRFETAATARAVVISGPYSPM
ncbi:MAG: hypothetical protein RMJ84_10925 [Sandaracinaceae bacterium]|nr:hypothetical protein [Sandaracinaceae bacterium]